jgi:soluble lytic murein transglycosylase-like protein/TolA-binding protein
MPFAFSKPVFPLRKAILARGAAALCLFLAPLSASAPAAPAKPSAKQVRAFQVGWQAALIDSRAGRHERAARALEKIQPGDSLAAAYRASFLAGAWLAAGQPRRAARLLDAALAANRDVPWQRHLYRLRLRAYDPSAPGAERREFLARALRAPLDDALKAQVLYRLLELDAEALPARERIGYVRQLASVAYPNSLLEAEYRKWAVLHVPGGPDREIQKLLLDLEEKLSFWPQAIERAEALQASAPEPEARALQLKIALWRFNSGAYAESIKAYDAWRERHGDSPEALIQTARAWRNLSQDARAQGVYSRLLEAFPKDARSVEVLWMRAFDAEAAGRYEDAIEGYSRILDGFPQHARAPEAMFRIGFAYYKRGDLEASQRAFREMRLAQKTGRFAGIARYWEGKVMARRGEAAAARAAWVELVSAWPFGFYGHQARRHLIAAGAWPDSLDWDRRFRDRSDPEVLAWMKSVMPGTKEIPPGAGESPYLPLNKLLQLGQDTLALITLQARAAASPSNPWELYRAAEICREAGFDYEAYRYGVRLAERLPLEAWPTAPRAVLRLFYPPSYESLVRMEATRASLAPSLVLALIKQESGFEPRAVSRVGARGLMQMMPATGAQQARKEKMEGFHPDSLFVPRVNTRLGIAYLRDVLRRYDGNPYYALAHYNAGPTALDRWMPRLRGRPPEESVEDIGYAETREYVKRVMANYWTYQALWH